MSEGLFIKKLRSTLLNSEIALIKPFLDEAKKDLKPNFIWRKERGGYAVCFEKDLTDYFEKITKWFGDE